MENKREKAHIIVVSGLPRSGTSLMMSMLKAGGLPLLLDEQREADIDNPKGYYEYAPVKTLDKGGDLTWMASAEGKGLKVVSPLLKYLPKTFHYKVIFVRRNLKEILLSQKKMLLRLGEPDNALDSSLFDSFLAHLSRINYFLKVSSHFSVCYFNYTDLLTDPEKEATRISEFLERSMDTKAMASKVDPTLYRSRV